MRRHTGNVQVGGVSLRTEMTYPDDVVFAYNPMFLEIEIASSITSVDVVFRADSLTSRTIKVNLYQGKARVYYSRILELFFDNVKSERVKVISVEVRLGAISVHSFSHTVVWGALAIGERFDGYGVFKFDMQRPYMEKTRVWFRNFPFTVTLFQPGTGGQNTHLQAKYDDNAYDDSLSLYSPMFTMYLDKLSDIMYQGSLTDVCPSGKTIDAVLYAEDKKRFYALYDTDHICGSWGAQPPFIFDSTYYNGSSGKPRTDMIWGWPGDHSFYRFDKSTDQLIKSNYGYYGDYGLFELTPEFTFPNAKHTATYRQDNPSDSTSKTSVFDETFDYTFFNSSEFTTIINLIINNDESGYYLRWIDRFGCFQYYLFKSGEATIKNKLSGNTFVEMTANDGMWFPNHTRDIQISATDTRKCQANSIPDEIFAYVSSIITSPVIDLYLGKTKLGEEIWVPVNIVASSHKYKPKDVLHNLEISFTMPDIQAQSL